MNDPLGDFRNVFIMSRYYKGDAMLFFRGSFVEFLKKFQNFRAGFRVEISSRFIGQHE
ncbi:MAG: hypothetical protein HYT41_00955 [Candidatus Sungbacteria bacterium]|nr:hypothetical protein [Candidatus Sungbacteria bacterium]